VQAWRRPFHCAFGFIPRARMLQALNFEGPYMIDESEREDFKQAIRESRLELSDFELIESQCVTSGAGVKPDSGTVTVKRKSTKTQRVYQAGHRTAWPIEFIDDLKNGVFS
tara:strand:- start:1522 stop:1854 length:333 start_codon:yes stop_codon:yes gene_type:complete